MWRDLERLCEKFALPWKHPSRFPRNSVPALRIACAVVNEPWCGAFVRRVFTANFGEDREIEDEVVLRDLLRELRLDAEAILALAASPPHRGALRANTERAVSLGIFGAPNCVVGEELFWGEEALEDAIAWAKRTDRALTGLGR